MKIPGWLKRLLTLLVKVGKGASWIDPNAQRGPSVPTGKHGDDH